MTYARRVVPGMTVMITRRTLRRTHLLRPDKQLTNLFLYALAVLSARHGIEVHAAVLMSTHEHLIVTDTRGELPCFLRDLHRIVALGVKALRKWEGPVWDHEKTSVVELCTPHAIVQKLAYVMANPVAAGLVQRSAHWPGVNTQPAELGLRTWQATRPTTFFSEHNNQWPVVAAVKLTLPPSPWATADELRAQVASELCTLEEAARETVRERSWAVVGSRKLVAMSPFRRARSWEPLRARNPTFAVGREMKEAFFACVQRLRQFRHTYKDALHAWRSGARHVLFPAGTWSMRVVHGAAVA
jgi:putative transposase